MNSSQYVGKSFKTYCSYCNKLDIFSVIGETRNFYSKDLEIQYVTECQKCGCQYFITTEKLKELVKK